MFMAVYTRFCTQGLRLYAKCGLNHVESPDSEGNPQHPPAMAGLQAVIGFKLP